MQPENIFAPVLEYLSYTGEHLWNTGSITTNKLEYAFDMTTPKDILAFWFGSADLKHQPPRQCRDLWFAATPEVDSYVADHFGTITTSAIQGELGHWHLTLEGELALLILCDQLSRNINRGTGLAFAGDAKALKITEAVIQRGATAHLGLYQQVFLGMPLEHSELAETQQRSVDYFQLLQQTFTEDKIAAPYLQTHYRYALAHQDIITQFGRFPHRNAALGRISTPAETEWLAQGGGFK
ncbi:DUF924 domain-containing protein [Microbulbifer sp. OS29]|uniref:DUF924 domain-containing protein n=1 Tax=Microbulbifer okhotskensis TaxID=2926617 RepID=A0A9X2EPR2_9GAMM|nr:DUF924 family protein [Microbulbifer okhotskensis]MCO1333336.1 DUF924 domain-containing protein [Microbulbifer okhotskensis]